VTGCHRKAVTRILYRPKRTKVRKKRGRLVSSMFDS